MSDRLITLFALAAIHATAAGVSAQCDAPMFHPFAIYGNTRAVPFDLDGTGFLELVHPEYGVFITTFDEGVTPRLSELIDSATQTYAAAGDFDGDGDDDLVLSVYPETRTYRNDSGVLTPWQSLGSGETKVYVVDLEGDGDDDIITHNYIDDAIGRFENDGSGAFSRLEDWDLSAGTGYPVPCSLNGDERVDLLLHPSGSHPTRALVQQADGNAVVIETDLDGVDIGAVGDVNGDSRDDVAQLGGVIRTGLGDGTFGGTLQAITDGEIVALADVDADGDADLVAAYDAEQRVAIHLNDGSGAFSEVQRFFPLKTAVRVLLADMNRDGVADLLAKSQHFLQLRFGIGGGLFEDLDPMPTAPALGIAPADLDGDGDLDVLATTKHLSIGEYYLESFENDGAGGLTPGSRLELPVSVGVRPAAIDLDWDGDLDVVQPGWDKLLLHENTGDAIQLREQRSRQRASNPPDMAFVADVDGDDHEDLVFWDGGVKILLTRGDWDFEEIIPALDADDGLYGAQDITGDGIADLVLSGRGDLGRITIYPGLGGATFGAPIPVLVSTLPDFVVAGDVDADGDCDLVYIEDEPYFVEQTAPGQFVERGVIGSGYYYRASALAIEDLNGDGAQDVVVGQAKTSPGNAKVGIIFGDRTQPLSRELLVSPFAVPLDVELGDMNGDGAADILLSDYMDSSDAWLYVVPNLCAAPCPGDFDGNGLADSRDVIAFLNAWVTGDDRADYDHNGDIDSRDVIAFLNLWSAGC